MRNMSDLKDKITQDQHAGQLRRMNSVFTVNSYLEIQLETMREIIADNC